MWRLELLNTPACAEDLYKNFHDDGGDLLQICRTVCIGRHVPEKFTRGEPNATEICHSVLVEINIRHNQGRCLPQPVTLFSGSFLWDGFCESQKLEILVRNEQQTG